MSDSSSPVHFEIDPAQATMRDFFVEEQFKDPSIHDLPARVRGEDFNQPHLVSYGYDKHEYGVSLLAFHSDRAIVVQTDIALDADACAEVARLSKTKIQRASEFLIQIRRHFVGFHATALRLLKRKPPGICIEGPFIPAGPGLACMMLILHISRDAHFDHVYERAKRYLELHPANDDRARFLEQWNPKPTSQGPPPYPWTAKELNVVENMARLEPYEDDDDPWELMRRAYNDFIFGEVNRDAPESANDLLSKIYQGP